MDRVDKLPKVCIMGVVMLVLIGAHVCDRLLSEDSIACAALRRAGFEACTSAGFLGSACSLGTCQQNLRM